MEKTKDDENLFFSMNDLRRTAVDLFFAGSETTSNMIRWTLLYLAKFPEVQKKLQGIIDEVVPEGSLPGYENRGRLAYADAVINESLRYASLVKFGAFLTTESDVTLNGYVIPKSSIILSAAYLCHQDSDYWDNPDEFRPERFLDENGKLCIQKDAFLPFGVGRRQCLGELLARMELFYFVTSLAQKFNFRPIPGGEIDITPDPTQAFINVPKEQLILITLGR